MGRLFASKFAQGVRHVCSWLASGNLGKVNTRATPILIAAAALLLGACQPLPVKPPSADGTDSAKPAPAVEAAKVPELPFAEPPVGVQELDGDLLFDYLVGEIGARTGELSAALDGYLNAAEAASDAYAAERATRIAIHLQDQARGERAARLWSKLAPNSIVARQLSGLLLLRGGQADLAQEQFSAALRIAEAQGEDGMLRVAMALNAEPDAEAAVQLMDSVVKLHPQDPYAYYALALVQTRHQRYPAAEQSLRQAIELRPEWAQPRILLSRVLLQLGRSDQARLHLANALRDYPEQNDLRISFARLLVTEGEYELALQQFEILHRKLPKSIDVSYGYAMLATQQSHWEEARELWQVLRNEPRYREEATYFLAQVEQAEGNDKLAMGLYRAVTDEDLRVDALIRLASLLAERSQIPEAMAALQEARESQPERALDIYLAEGQILQDAGAQETQVEQVYAQALEAFPEDLELLYQRGLYYSSIGRYQQMEADFQAVLQRDPENAEALNALGYTLADINQRLDEAYRYIKRALDLRPGNRAILDSLGWVYYRKGNYPKALEFLRAAHQGEIDDEIAAHFGEVLWVSGDQSAAKKIWREALQQVPESQPLRAVMGRFLDR